MLELEHVCSRSLNKYTHITAILEHPEIISIVRKKLSFVLASSQAGQAE